MLAESQPDTDRPLYTLRMALLAELRRIKKDGDITRKVAQRPFLPHLSLTIGLIKEEAQALAKRAKDAQLSVNFRVDRIHLVSFEPTSPPKTRGVLHLYKS